MYYVKLLLELNYAYIFVFSSTGLGGVNIIEKLEEASAEVVDGAEKGKVLLDFNGTMGERIQVFVEWAYFLHLLDLHLSIIYLSSSKKLSVIGSLNWLASYWYCNSRKESFIQ